MHEKKSHRSRFDEQMPGEVREHFREARKELGESMKEFLPPGFIEHRRKATQRNAARPSFGKNGNCAGTGGVFRMDRSRSLDWVGSFLP